ncbi:phosphatidylinositol 4-kinase Stt4p [[Candida] jaroonii]|uniref:Phosphatidylinositol 4-kinase Stt4p n=1 Tax=[Candida] jaroonii TaxID=467808 RepID=A0ACA9YBX5_9ASCO|nr:phosphatidylinositol 4-kinase Stt4p [[Candida] jaroonii]
MDYYGIPRGFIRSEAYKKLAKLSVENTPSNLKEINSNNEDSFSRLMNKIGNQNLSKVEMSLEEFEVLVALCESTNGEMKFPKQASLLLDKIGLYLIELPYQRFKYEVLKRHVKPTPWFILGEKLTMAAINLSFKFDNQFLDQVIELFQQFNSSFFNNKNLEHSNYFAVLGYIESLTQNSKILVQSSASFKIFNTLDACIDNFEFLNDLEIYSNNIYRSNNTELAHLIEATDDIVELSPIYFIESLSKLMCSIINAILNNESLPLLEFLLEKVSKKVDEDSPIDLEVREHHMSIIKNLTNLALQKMEFLDRGESFIVYSTFNRLKIGYLAKSYNLQVIGCGMFTDNMDLAICRKLFKNCLSIYDVMLDSDLGGSVIQLGSLLVFKDETIGSSLTRAFTALVANPKFGKLYCDLASKSVGSSSKVLSQDAVVTTIYALTNLLFVNNDSRGSIRRNTLSRPDNLSMKDLSLNGNSKAVSRKNSISSINASHLNGVKSMTFEDTEYLHVCENAINAIVHIVERCNDESVSTLAVTILSQKTTRLDSSIGSLLLKGLISCAPCLPEREFLILNKLINKLSLDAFNSGNVELLNNLIEARVELSHKIKQEHPLFTVYLQEILAGIVGRGDVQVLEHHRSHNEISEIGDQISIYLKPLAELLPNVYADEPPLQITDTKTINLFRNIWFNMVVHGYSNNSKNVKQYSQELERVAHSSPPLASELSWDRTETSLELNTVLRRGSSNHNVKDHKNILNEIFEVPRTLSYPKLMFLSATFLVETFRVRTGDCSKVLYYYSDPSIKISGVDRYIGYISFKIVREYIKYIDLGANKNFSSDNIAEQLTNLLVLCCHRLEDLQDSAIQCCDLLINKSPSALCHQKSLFAIFDLLTLLFDSVIDADENQYEPTTSYRAKRTGIHLLLSDNYKWRNDTFKRFNEKSRHWIKLVLIKSNVDVKSLIQMYISDLDKFQSSSEVQYGVSFALEMAGSILPNERELSNISRFQSKNLNSLPSFVSQLTWRSNFISELLNKVPLHTSEDTDRAFNDIRSKVIDLNYKLEDKSVHVSKQEIVDLLSDIAGLTLICEDNVGEMVRYLVEIPFKVLESNVMHASIGIWFAVMKDRSNISGLLLSEICKRWEISIALRQGLFSKVNDLIGAEFDKMEYSPSDYKHRHKVSQVVVKNFEPHLQIIKLFSSSFESTLNQSDHLLKLFTRFIEVSLKNLDIASLHPYARYTRFELIKFAFDIVNYHSSLGTRSELYLTELILDASLSWFKQTAKYPFGSNLLKIKSDLGLLKDVAKLMSSINTHRHESLESKKIIIMFFLDDEISRISIWLNPSNPVDVRGSFISNKIDGHHIIKAYKVDPTLAVNLALRYKVKNLDEILQKLLTDDPLPAIGNPSAVQYLIGINAGTNFPTHHLLFWEALSPIDAIQLFLPPFGSNPYILQYTMRSLEHHDVNLTFFYVPQIVQSLRFDAKGYVERFIIETARVSQLFAHQIIWNMLANSYKDDDGNEPDALKPTLDRVQNKMLKSYSEEDLQFYEKEFGFFNEVTNISGKLKPYIKKSKAEKKIKIDEEMSKIEVLPGVYLPSNPDGVVIDINRKSGKPLQSHAKAPFMATFKIKKEIEDIDEYGEKIYLPIERWQSAIFKVGDDCRQDVLALQLISVFRSIWTNAGLDLFVYPYRVTATAPGCGVIDVLPNSTSRDMLGREAVNGLYEYFTTKFGPENSIEFQQARNNLIRSLAAYSIISYILQFKDRHNGNIMYDDQGHVIHIDFGFCFDIVPGGVKFEVAPFKLTHEMVMVLGGSNETQAFQWFEELCVKGFLACRPYMETIVRCVNPMLESGLPCFKDTTVKKLRQRFVPNKPEKDAVLHMRGLIKKAMESYYTKGYDEFQRLTNGIPY